FSRTTCSTRSKLKFTQTESQFSRTTCSTISM
ncbi:unnamed protein product, partial [Rotaria sp. Silwood2]